MDGIIAVVPSLNPDEKLAGVIGGLRAAGLDDIVVVNDGSAEACLRFFPAETETGITRLDHPVNRGKGRALKTAFTYITENRPDCKAVVVVDGDGQHTAEDSVRVAARALESGRATLGVRDFDQPGVPKKSRAGNKITRTLFRLVFGIRVSDTQTGLRGFPAGMLPMLTQIAGDRFEYETNMLLALHEADAGIEEVPIQTLYINQNETSHFRPVVDSIRILSIFARFLKFSVSSLLASLIDNLVFYIIIRTLAGFFGVFTATAAFVTARLISSAVNFSVNRRIVFGHGGQAGRAAGRYYALAAVRLIAASAVLNLIVLPLNMQAGAATLTKIVIDVILFFINYHFQKKWVFGS